MNKLLEMFSKFLKVPQKEIEQVVTEDIAPPPAPKMEHKELGFISRKFESGTSGPGTISSGKGDPGGKSYGCHQLASKTGTLYAYLRRSRYHDQFAPVMAKKFHEPGPAFDRTWKRIAREEPEMFAEDQFRFIKKKHYTNLRIFADRLGIPRTKAINEALFSIGVQHGRAKKVVESAGILDTDKERDIVNKLYDAREKYVKRIRLPAGTRRAVLNRYRKERRMVLDLL